MKKDFIQFFREFYFPKRKPTKFKDIKVDVIINGDNVTILKHGTKRELSWRIVGIRDEEKQKLGQGLLHAIDKGYDVFPVKHDPVRRTGYMLHIMRVIRK